MRLAARVTTSIAVLLGSAQAAIPAHGTTGPPHQTVQLGIAADGTDALAAVVGLAADNGGGVAITDAAGGQRLTSTGDELYTATGTGTARALVVDETGRGFATFAGDQKVHVLAPDGTEIGAYDLSGLGATPTTMVLDRGAPDYPSARELYVTTDIGVVVINPDVLSTDPSVFPQAVLVGVAVDAVAPDHTLLAANHASGTFSRYTDDGIYLGQTAVPAPTGSPSSPPNVAGIAADGAGNVFVSDSANHRVVELTPAGSFLGQFGQANPQSGDGIPASQTPGALDGPGLLSVDCHGRLWVVDTDTQPKSRVVAFTGVASPRGVCGKEPTTVAGPSSQQALLVAVDRADDLYLTSVGVVEKYDAAGHLVTHWGYSHPQTASPTPAAEFGLPSALATAPNGDVWVSSYRWPIYDSNGNIVSVVNAEPKLLRFGPTGTLRQVLTAPIGGGTAFTSPGTVAIRGGDGHLFVADNTAHNVQELDGTGHFIRAYPVPAPAGSVPSATPFILTVALDTQGRLLVSASAAAGNLNGYTWRASAVDRFVTTGATAGSLLDTIATPRNGATTNPPSSIVVRSDGSMLWGAVPFLPPGVVPYGSLLSVGANGHPVQQVLDGTFPAGVAPKLAIDCAGRVYATDLERARTLVLRYSTARCTWLPTATTGPVTHRARTALTVSASANPSAQVTKLRVLYGPTTRYGKATAWITVPSDNVVVTKSVVLSGLLHLHTYHYRVQVQNGSGTVTGADRTGRTL